MTLRIYALTLCAVFTLLRTAHSQVNLSVAGAGIHYSPVAMTYVLEPELIAAGSNYWQFDPIYNQASGVVEFSTAHLRTNDSHYLAFEEAGSTTVCAGTPNQFQLHGYVGNGLAEISDRLQTNTFLASFETPRGYTQERRLLNVSSFVNGLISTGQGHAGFLLSAADGCAFEGFGYAALGSTNSLQILLVSASDPPRLFIDANPSNPDLPVVRWVELPSMTNYVLQSNTDLSQTNGWMAVTNGPPTLARYTRTVQVPASGSARFYRLKRE